MTKKGLITSIVMLNIALAACATGKITVTPVPQGSASATKTDLKGAIYTLPRTVVRLELPVERVEQKPGRHALVADLFFPDKSRVRANASPLTFRLKKATISTFGEPDPDQIFLVKAEGGGAIDQTMTFDYTEQGALLGAQATVDNQTADVLLGILSAATGIITRIGGGDNCTAEEQKKKALWCFLSHPELRENLDGLPPKRQDELNALYGTNVDAFKAARVDYDAIRKYINETTEFRESIDLPADAETSREFIVRERDRLADEMIAKLFVGKKSTSSWTGIWALRPGRKPFDDVIKATGALHTDHVLDFVTDKGICKVVADLRGHDAPPPEFQAEAGDCTTVKSVKVDYALDGADQIASRTYANFRQPTPASFRYAIPSQIKLTLKEDATERAQARAMISQFGWIAALPETLGGKAVTFDLKFYETTGGLKTFKLASKPLLTKGLVDGLSSSANAFLDDRKQDKKDADTKADRLTQLERERKLVEEEYKLRDFCIKLGVECRIP